MESLMVRKAKRAAAVKSKTPLSEGMITRILSNLSGKEAAQTMTVSKSWYTAWQSRPNLEFDEHDFELGEGNKTLLRIEDDFEEFATKTMERYIKLRLKIESFVLRTYSLERSISDIAHRLTVKAIELGATCLEIDLRYCFGFLLPCEVLESETLMELSLRNGRFVGGSEIKCWRLKSLHLKQVTLEGDDLIGNITSCCSWIEELTLLECSRMSRTLAFKELNLYKLRNLRILFLKKVILDESFFSDLTHRFHCLEELSIHECQGYKVIQICSTSIKCISIVETRSLRAELNVPDIRKFSYSGLGVPDIRKFPYSGLGVPSVSLNSNGWSECECELTLDCNRVRSFSWFLRLNKFLAQLKGSRISLFLKFRGRTLKNLPQGKNIRVEMIHVDKVEIDSSPLLHDVVVRGLHTVCRPRILTFSL